MPKVPLTTVERQAIRQLMADDEHTGTVPSHWTDQAALSYYQQALRRAPEAQLAGNPGAQLAGTPGAQLAGKTKAKLAGKKATSDAGAFDLPTRKVAAQLMEQPTGQRPRAIVLSTGVGVEVAALRTAGFTVTHAYEADAVISRTASTYLELEIETKRYMDVAAEVEEAVALGPDRPPGGLPSGVWYTPAAAPLPAGAGEEARGPLDSGSLPSPRSKPLSQGRDLSFSALGSTVR